MIEKIFFIIFSFFLIFTPGLVWAANDSALALTITPPLMKINMEPGESLATAVNAVNNNSYPVTVYAKIVDFADNGNGEIKFLNNGNLPETPENKSVYLSQWITLSQEKQDLPPFQTATFSFSIDVPLNAQPGGHYAAILIGTNPPAETAKGTEIKVTSYISSLILARVAGAIEEKGMIREFTFSNRIYRGGEGNFRVRFDNLGNVHLAPTGDIRIFDMFGKQQGEIPVNIASDFGNVLPKGERTWDNLKWSGDNFFLINRYRAELSLSYGEQAKQTEFATFFFWGFNWRWLSLIGGGLLLFLVLIFIFVRYYIRRSVKGLEKQLKAAETARKKAEKKTIKEAGAAEKLEEKKVIDLRKKS
ncbi:MAG: hypothetical protein PHE24_02745 [Patescibacteria group bacterium]|nr:hypothetical protein [Patescibacteria group bacterium]